MPTQKQLIGREVLIDYTNWKGDRRWRKIVPIGILFATTPHHEQRQWFLHATDVEKQAVRYFALKDIHAWQAPT